MDKPKSQTSAKVKIPMPDAHMYGLMGDVERNSAAERRGIYDAS